MIGLRDVLAISQYTLMNHAKALSSVVVLDGATVRVREANIRSIILHVAKPLAAQVVAVWQGLNASVQSLLWKYGILGKLELDVKPEEFVDATWQGLEGNFLRTIFYAAYTKYRTWHMVQRLEFDWIVYTRSDMRWFVDLPPRHLWEDSGLIWVPDHADWGGIYDRAAIVPRQYAEVFLRGPFRALTSPQKIRERILGGSGVLNSEVLLHRMLKAAGANFGSFPLLGAIKCCLEDIPECSWHTTSSAPCYRGYRNYHEYTDAVHTKYFARGGTWATTVGHRQLTPGCFQGAFADVREFCCGENSSGCFEETNFYTERRCCGDKPYLTIHNQWVGPCWSLSHPDDAPIPPVACMPA